MSPSSFHQHFKLVTSMSPLQYQKQLRLLEACRLMLASGADATRAAYHVGYESVSHFSREHAYVRRTPASRRRGATYCRLLSAVVLQYLQRIETKQDSGPESRS